MPTPCSSSKSIGNYSQNPSIDSGDIFLVQKGTEYKKEPREAHIATQNEVNLGVNSTKYVTPATLKSTPKQDIGVYDFGSLLLANMPADNETFTIEVDSIPVIFEFTSGGGVTVGDVEVIKGVSLALTADSWILAINSSILPISAIINPSNTSLINWITDEANKTVVLTDGTSGDVLYSQAGGERAPANTVTIYREYTIQAADAAAGFVMFRFPVSSFPDGILMQVFSAVPNGANDDNAYDYGSTDNYTITNGDINLSIVTITATYIVKIFGIGVI